MIFGANMYENLFRTLAKELEKESKMTIDMNKKYTYEGFAARIICTDREDHRSVLALVRKNGHEEVCAFYYDGTADVGPPLIEVKPDVIFWQNVYGTAEMSWSYKTREKADEGADKRARTNVIEHNLTKRTSTWHEVEK